MSFLPTGLAPQVSGVERIGFGRILERRMLEPYTQPWLEYSGPA